MIDLEVVPRKGCRENYYVTVGLLGQWNSMKNSEIELLAHEGSPESQGEENQFQANCRVSQSQGGRGFPNITQSTKCNENGEMQLFCSPKLPLKIFEYQQGGSAGACACRLCGPHDKPRESSSTSVPLTFTRRP